jgi:hypothetical protein
MLHLLHHAGCFVGAEPLQLLLDAQHAFGLFVLTHLIKMRDDYNQGKTENSCKLESIGTAWSFT